MKVFLVEDEVIIRNGIKNCIDWEAEGYEFVGEASDGELAYPQIIELKPDVLITDIKMPFMDGIELSKLVREKLPDIKIVIVSGYSEFEYAKEAIQLGVTDYLLKPISAEKLLEAISKIKESIDKKKEELSVQEQYKIDMQEKTQYEKLKFFNRLVMGNMSMSDALKQAKELNIEISAQVYNFLLFKFIEDFENDEVAAVLNKAFKLVEEYFVQRTDAIIFSRGVEGWGIVLMGNSADDIMGVIEEFKVFINDIISENKNVRYYGALGSMVNRIGELKNSFHEANIIFANRFIGPYNKIFTLDDKNAENNSVKDREKIVDTIGFNGINSIEENRQLLTKFFKNGTSDEIENFIDVYFDKFNQDDLKSIIMRQYITMDCYVVAVAVVKELDITTDNLDLELSKMGELIENEHSLDKVKSYLRKLISYIIELRDDKAGNKNKDIVKEAKKYINDNYMQEDISLNTIAASVSMSPSYFSSIFRKDTGETVVEYLTKVRMEKAKELLRCSSKKTSEIGYEVGYKDSHYFSYIFKKTQKCTPKEYRLGGKNEAKE